jgi:hypothetical protein
MQNIYSGTFRVHKCRSTACVLVRASVEGIALPALLGLESDQVLKEAEVCCRWQEAGAQSACVVDTSTLGLGQGNRMQRPSRGKTERQGQSRGQPGRWGRSRRKVPWRTQPWKERERQES